MTIFRVPTSGLDELAKREAGENMVWNCDSFVSVFQSRNF